MTGYIVKSLIFDLRNHCIIFKRNVPTQDGRIFSSLTSDDVLLYLTSRLARSLGEAGLIEPETEGILIENGIDFDDFPHEVLACLPQNLPWSIPETELEYR